MISANKNTVAHVDGATDELAIDQPSAGYRFTFDSMLLAHFAAERCGVSSPERIVDLGAGCGIIGLWLARRFPRAKVTLVELQEELATVAAANIERNRLAGRVRAIDADLRQVDAWCDPPPELIVVNPPYYPRGSGRLSPDPQIALARHELSCSLAELVGAAASALATGGVIAMVHLRSRRGEIVSAMVALGLVVEVMQSVSMPASAGSAKRVLIAARKAAIWDQGRRGRPR